MNSIGRLTALCADGSQKTYGHFDDDPQEQKLWNFIQDIQAGREAACGLEAAFSQVLCVNGLQESQPEIVPFPAGLIQEMKEGESRRLWVKGLQEALEQSFAEGRLPGELGFFWSLPGRRVNLSEYHRFPKEVS